LQITIVDLEEGLAGVDPVTPCDVDRDHNAGDRRTDSDIFGARLDHTGTGHIRRERHFR
jgi:hypothetical protein